MTNSPKHCSFPSVENTRLTDRLDFTTIAPDTSIADLLTCLMAEVETAVQQLHEWEPGIDYTHKDILMAACQLTSVLITENHSFSLGYQRSVIPDEDYREWRNLRKKYLEQLKKNETKARKI